MADINPNNPFRRRQQESRSRDRDEKNTARPNDTSGPPKPIPTPHSVESGNEWTASSFFAREVGMLRNSIRIDVHGPAIGAHGITLGPGIASLAFRTPIASQAALEFDLDTAVFGEKIRAAGPSLNFHISGSVSESAANFNAGVDASLGPAKMGLSTRVDADNYRWTESEVTLVLFAEANGPEWIGRARVEADVPKLIQAMSALYYRFSTGFVYSTGAMNPYGSYE